MLGDLGVFELVVGTDLRRIPVDALRQQQQLLLPRLELLEVATDPLDVHVMHHVEVDKLMIGVMARPKAGDGAVVADADTARLAVHREGLAVLRAPVCARLGRVRRDDAPLEVAQSLSQIVHPPAVHHQLRVWGWRHCTHEMQRLPAVGARRVLLQPAGSAAEAAHLGAVRAEVRLA